MTSLPTPSVAEEATGHLLLAALRHIAHARTPPADLPPPPPTDVAVLAGAGHYTPETAAALLADLQMPAQAIPMARLACGMTADHPAE